MNVPSKIALITGAAKRLGQAIAIDMAIAGWDIAIHYGKSKYEAEQTYQKIIALGRKAVLLQADLASEIECVELIDRCSNELGVPDCIVNNASLFEYDEPGQINSKVFHQSMSINLLAPLMIGQKYVEKVRSIKNQKGVIIHLLDQKLANLNPDYFSYTLSKAGLEAALKMQAMSFAPQVRVVGIAPGITLHSGNQSDAGFTEAHAKTPMGKSSIPQDISQAVLYLANASAVTGTALYVDGGQHLQASNRDVMFLSNQL